MEGRDRKEGDSPEGSSRGACPVCVLQPEDDGDDLCLLLGVVLASNH